jgi:peptide deformylase
MNTLKLIGENDRILSQKCEEFDFNNSPFDAKEFEKELYEKMTKHNGLGLSANQVGVPYRIFAIRIDVDPLVIFNPTIVDQSENEILLDEGCLSFPLLYMKIKRPEWVRIRFQTSDGETHTEKYGGMTARVILHEYDHLEGITFKERASKFVLDRAMRKQMILKRAHKKANIEFFKRQRMNGTTEIVPQVVQTWYETDKE